MPWTTYRPPARRRSTSHEATKPPAPVTHTAVPGLVLPAATSIGTDHDDLRVVIKFKAGRLGDTPINLVQIVDVDNLALGDVLIPELPGYVYITLVGQRTRWDPMCIQYFVSHDAHGDRVWVYLVQLNCTSEVVF